MSVPIPLLFWLIHFLPYPVTVLLARCLAPLVYLLASRRRRIILRNLKVAFPEFSAVKRQWFALCNMAHFFTVFLTHSYLSSRISRQQRLFKGENVPSKETLANAIVFAPHFVGVGIATHFISLRQPVAMTHQTQHNQALEQWVLKKKRRNKPFATHLYSRDAGIRPLLKDFRNGFAIVQAPDMDFGTRGAVFVPFFGVPAATLTAPARLARLLGVPLIPAVVRLNGFRDVRIKFYPPLTDAKGMPFPGEMDDTTAAAYLNQQLEKLILEVPTQYLWAHRRFKNRPPGEASIY